MSLSISPENFGPICDELLDCPTGLVESIEHRHDLLNIFGIWVHVVVKKGVDQRQIFGTELFLQFIYLSDQLLSFLPVFLLSSLVDLLTEFGYLAIGLRLSLIATDDADNLLCIPLQLGNIRP